MTYQKSPLRGAQLARVRAGQPGWSPLPGAAAAIPFACVEALAPVTTRASVLESVRWGLLHSLTGEQQRTHSSAAVASLPYEVKTASIDPPVLTPVRPPAEVPSFLRTAAHHTDQVLIGGAARCRQAVDACSAALQAAAVEAAAPRWRAAAPAQPRPAPVPAAQPRMARAAAADPRGKWTARRSS
jgi:hypothetical protein